MRERGVGSLHGGMCIIAKVAQHVGLSDVEVAVLDGAPRAGVGEIARVGHSAMATELAGCVKELVAAEALVLSAMAKNNPLPVTVSVLFTAPPPMHKQCACCHCLS